MHYIIYMEREPRYDETSAFAYETNDPSIYNRNPSANRTVVAVLHHHCATAE